MWFRSFDNLVVVRVEKSSNGIFLFVKIGNGVGGYVFEGFKKLIRCKISNRKWNDFVLRLEEVGFDNLLNESYRLMIDGVIWILERKVNGEFKVYKINDLNDNYMFVCLFLV